ncbi:ABC transporter permease [Streptomyces sp. 6N223]|uniref:ABC transporter permease n=1 Tax=Streptomyces sp. 6N223 TaxID=3457412 RepID=UPI003FCFF316
MNPAFGRLLSVQTKRALREPAAVFFMVAFAPLFVLVMGVIFGNDPRPEFDDKGYIETNLASFTSIVIAIAGFLMIPVDVITQRESGALRRFRATPLRPGMYIAADVVVRFTILLLSVSAMFALGILAFDSEFDGSIVSMILAVVLGIFAFLAVGYALAAALPSPGAAQGMGNMLTYPLIVLSGGAVPLDVQPEGVRDISQFSPLTQLVEFLNSLWEGESWSENWVPVVVLAGLLVAATAVAARFFRWE